MVVYFNKLPNMKNNKVKRGWAFYDWANSVYSLVISTAVFPIYFSSVSPEEVSLFGHILPSETLYSYSLTASFILVSLLSPFLSGIADYTGNKKGFLQFFCYLGSLSCILLFFFDGTNLYYGLFMSIMASLGFWGSIVFYNAFLPEIAKPEEQDNLSAKGFSYGYIGSAILLIICLVLITFAESIGFSGAGAATRFCFILVGLWWAGFAQFTFARLPKNIHHRKPGKHYVWSGFKELALVIDQLKGLTSLRRFLYSFFFLSAGVQTIILLASLFGDSELGLSSDKLIMTILLIQFVAIGGAHLFAYLSKKFGNMASLKISIAIWALLCFGAYSLTKTDPLVEYKFYALGAIVGLVMGGIQSISRSTYSKLLPKSKSNASFFSFYDVSEKVALVVGTFVFGYLIDITGSMKASALMLSVFFVISFLLILRIKKTKEVH